MELSTDTKVNISVGIVTAMLMIFTIWQTAYLAKRRGSGEMNSIALQSNTE